MAQPSPTGARAPFAADPARASGRVHAEPESATRSPYERDRDRIIHCSAFRRLKHKTQVFVAHEGDHFRTRLTHSLEVAQLARSLARRLRLDEDLAEACALAHDLGHPPFGHTGEHALEQCMEAFGGFDHNAQTIRVIAKLERTYPAFDGLNLTRDTLEGVIKHNGPLAPRGGDLSAIPAVWRELSTELGLYPYGQPLLEAQVAALADDVAYNNHDIDDGLRAGMFTLEDICAEVPMVGEAFESVRRDFPGLDQDRLIGEAVRRLIGEWMGDLAAESASRIAAAGPRSPDDVRALERPLIGFSDAMIARGAVLRQFLMARMYRHWRVNRVRSRAKKVVRELFEAFLEELDTLPPNWRRRADPADPARSARVVCDYIAGMTDVFAVDEHRRMLNLARWP